MAIFKLQHESGKARAGLVKTHHGDIQTPMFMPVGTRASVKTMTQEDLESMGAEVILGNTYHLYIRPGHKLIERVGGGLHGFMSWDRPILTDSGGFQVYSLSTLRQVKEEGVHFKSHLDGSLHFIGPEESMEIQRALGSDIVMAFDELISLPAPKERIEDSVERTLRWAKRCRDVELKKHQNLFGIVQGGLDRDLRLHCLNELKKMNFDGYALGGLSVGEKNEEMVSFLDDFVCLMPKDYPRYLMGVGTPLDILNGVRAGLDLFDCVLPCRNARNGQALTSKGPVSVKRAEYLEDTSPLDENCSCRVCQRYTKAYIRHLYMVKEYLAGQLLTYHNLYFYINMMREIRKAIQEDRFDEYYQAFYKNYSGLN